MLEERETAARVRVEGLREEAARPAGELEVAEIELDRRVIAREELVEALAASAAETTAATEAEAGRKAVPAPVAVPGSIVPPWHEGSRWRREAGGRSDTSRTTAPSPRASPPADAPRLPPRTPGPSPARWCGPDDGSPERKCGMHHSRQLKRSGRPHVTPPQESRPAGRAPRRSRQRAAHCGLQAQTGAWCSGAGPSLRAVWCAGGCAGI